MVDIPSFARHASVIVPLETWCFQSPSLLKEGRRADIGLLAEALIYYDNIFLGVQLPSDLDALIKWFAEDNRQRDLVRFFKDGTFHVYHHAFISTAIRDGDNFSIWNIQGQDQSLGNTFESRILSQVQLDKYLEHARHRSSLLNAISERTIEAKSEEFGPAIENARIDSTDADRCVLYMQSLIDEIYPLLGDTRPVKVEALVESIGDNKRITWNLNFNKIAEALGPNANFHLGTPLVAAAVANRTIQSAGRLNCDLYLASPMSGIVGDKLFEAQSRSFKTSTVIDQLIAEVEFPNIRKLVNEGKLKLGDILALRQKAKKFRLWLQNESDRDRNALIAYHNEIAKESGFQLAGRSTLKLFGVLGGGAAGAVAGAIIGGPATSTVGAAIGGAAASSVIDSSVGYLFDIASNLGGGWKPVVFGDWMRSRIEKLIRSQNTSSSK